LGTWDHVFLRGIEPRPAGVVDVTESVSDHRAVWVVAILR
jgi:hypothetical protein